MSGFAAETSRAIEGSGKVSNVLDSRLQFSHIHHKSYCAALSIA
ncbi:hypothetical protein VCRA2116O30_100100 [Vibrio crassostreae]|nr:hypothetical protein VCRA2116O30_100100 [Vibrio crassostreae]CAK1702623.1 hypothetical protein VCRA2119O45_100100 [Vibrio crassostreae]CAK1864722.1 hypothetical protein VCRA2118O41_10362 [Vibrio crassostreae]CAK1875640.1 hypothetical protein VCRA2116O28_10421 [Vibrio crassostreae]CAK1877293.1 hypothetical protein VCRA2116O27_10420 [Vibrio crassostreae]